MLATAFRNLKNSIWLLLALLVHLLLYVTVAVHFAPVVYTDEEDKSLPAYIYHDDTPPRPTPYVMPDTTANVPLPETTQSTAAPAPQEKQNETDKNGILPTEKTAASQQEQKEGKTRSLNTRTPMGAINIKAEKQVDRPLLRILSKATAAKLFYPKIAADFRVSGKCLIRFLITPQGEVSDVTLVESSGAGVLDTAAMETIKAISPVAGVSEYLHEPQHLTVDIIYD
jgi:TonB family protein